MEHRRWTCRSTSQMILVNLISERDRKRSRHEAWDYVPSASTRASKREYMRRRRREHPEKTNESVARSRAKNPIAKYLSNRRWLIENREAARESSRKWRREHPNEARADAHRRRLVRGGARGVATGDQIAARVAYYGEICAYCGGPFEHVEHAIPLSRGGTNWPANLRPSCAACNLAKGTKTPFEFEVWVAKQAVLLTVDFPCARLINTKEK